jgi:hypothetical protein
MFPNNCGFDLVFIADLTSGGYPALNVLGNESMRINWSKATYLRKNFANIYNFFITFWQGSYSNYIKYANQIEEYYTKPDLVVSFHPDFVRQSQSQQQKSQNQLVSINNTTIAADWSEDLKTMLSYNLTCLFTFCDKEEKEKAYNVLNACQANFVSIASNQFSSLLLKQTEHRPNQIEAKNGFGVIVKGFSNLNGGEHSYNLAQQQHNIHHLTLASNEDYKYLKMNEHHTTLLGNFFFLFLLSEFLYQEGGVILSCFYFLSKTEGYLIFFCIFVFNFEL